MKLTQGTDVTDDQLIIQLGMQGANPGKTQEEIARYNSELKTVIQQLQAEGTFDTKLVAARIAKFRRDFLEDPTAIVTQ